MIRKMKITEKELIAHLSSDKRVLALSLHAFDAYVKLAMISLPDGGVIMPCGFIIDRKALERFLGDVEVLDELITSELVAYDFDNPRVQLGAEELDAGPFSIPFIADRNEDHVGGRS